VGLGKYLDATSEVGRVVAEQKLVNHMHTEYQTWYRLHDGARLPMVYPVALVRRSCWVSPS
jgi:hypothetical protein